MIGETREYWLSNSLNAKIGLERPIGSKAQITLVLILEVFRHIHIPGIRNIILKFIRPYDVNLLYFRINFIKNVQLVYNGASKISSFL
jgi:hypothetical protein